MDGRPPEPPRIAEVMLQATLPAGVVREDIVRSLAEEYAAYVGRHGRRAARWWYRRQVAGIVARAVWRGVGRATERGLFRDVGPEWRRAVRRLARAPVFTTAVVTTLALGIGGTTGVFGIVYGVILRPLPYPEADRLLWVRNEAPDRTFGFSMADALALFERQTSFSSVAAYDPNGITLSTEDGSARQRAHMVTAGYMPVLGMEPMLGRGISAEDTRPGADRVAVVSYGTWRTWFGEDPDAVGRTVTLDQQATTVVGVLPPTTGPIEKEADFILPLALEQPPRKGPFFLNVVGHLSEGVAREAANAELEAISAAIFPEWQDSFPRPEVRWRGFGLKESILGGVGATLWVAMGAVASLLLIALANATNLLVARAAEGEHERTVRIALGAGRADLLLHRFAESATLTLLGTGAGVCLAAAGLGTARRVGGPFMPRIAEAALDGPVLGFLAVVAALSAVLLAVAPSMVRSRGATEGGGAGRSGWGGGGRTVTGGPASLRHGLVAAQLVVTVPLLVGGALLGTSLHALRSTDPGFDAERVVTLDVTLPPVGYETGERIRGFFEEVLGEVRALPGVEAVGIANGRPPDEPGFGNNFVLEDVPVAEGEAQHSVPWLIANAGYLDALGVGVVAGRMFDTADDSARVALVDEAWARRFFDGPTDAVGRRFVHGGCTDLATCDLWTVIGVVETVDYNGLQIENEGSMYLDADRFTNRGMFIAARAETVDPGTLTPAIRAIVRDVDPTVPVADVAVGTELIRTNLRADRYLTTLIAVFAGVALVLSLVGVYGVLAYYVERHRREIGIRLALGGEPRSVAALVVATAMKLVTGGVVIGSALALGLARSLEAVLYGVDPRDPVSFVAVGTFLIGAALLASWGPARRATRLDPARALKEVR